MKKITVEKNEGIAEVIDRMLAIEDSEIVLVIPKGAALGKSASSFRLLKREADSAEKSVIVDSPDENIRELADKNGVAIAGVKHPHGATGLSDIVVKGGGHGDDEEAASKEEDEELPRKRKPVKLAIRDESDESDEEDAEDEEDKVEPEDDDEEEEKKDDEKSESFFGDNRFFKPRILPMGGSRNSDDDGESRGISGKAVAWTIGIIVILAIAFYATTVIFGRAQVTIDFTQTPWNIQTNFVADKSVSAVTMNGTVTSIPAQVFTTQKNVTQLFPATGQGANVSIKAQGTITIYNDYSSAPQDLVATTRFQTPDGKIFRLVDNVTVPGATVAAGGAITPSSVTAQIVADQGGPAYNVGPVTKLTIPGFAKIPAKETGFYGAITGMTTGGFTGTRTIPTAADVAGAKASTTAILQADLQDGLTASYPGNFKILDGATDIQITKMIVSTSTDANGNFSVFGEASLTAIGFDESALESYLLSAATNGGTSSTFKTVDLSYSSVQANFSKGQVNFVLSGTGTIEPAFSPSDFASSLSGESIGVARDAIQSLPQLSDGKISVWPVWLWSMPSNPAKITVTAN